MSLSKKYNISPEAVNKMVKDGVISCSWPAYEEIYQYYKNMLPRHLYKTDAIHQVAKDKNVSIGTVYNILHKFE